MRGRREGVGEKGGRQGRRQAGSSKPRRTEEKIEGSLGGD